MTTHRSIRFVAASLGLVALIAGWLVAGPAQLGGGTTYALVVGNSMEPQLQRGDLVLVRPRGSYGVGDVVLYESPRMRTKVLHRIVRVENGRYVLKGDHNDFTDDERVTDAQIAGALRASVPFAGRLREPRNAALFAGLAVLLAVGIGGAAANGKDRRRMEQSHLLVGFGVAAVVLGALTVLAFATPTTATRTIGEAFAHEGRFDYRATVRRNAVYPDGRVNTGQPVFLRLVPALDVSFRYRLRSADRDVAGTIGLDARLSDGRGWERLFELAAPRPFDGSQATVSGTLDLRRIEALTERMRALTGSAQSVFTLTVLPQVFVHGETAVDSSFAPALAFELADLRLQPSLDGTGTGLGPFAPREAEPGATKVPAQLSAGPFAIPVRTGRLLFPAGAAACLLAGALLLARRRGGPADAEHELIAARYGELLLPVSSRPPERRRVNEVPDIESLVRLASRHDRLILQLVEGGEHSYLVEDDGSVYRYRIPRRSVPATAASPVEAATR